IGHDYPGAKRIPAFLGRARARDVLVSTGLRSPPAISLLSDETVRRRIGAELGGEAPKMSLIDDSSYWRARAEEARITADCMIDANCSSIMRRIAGDY